MSDIDDEEEPQYQVVFEDEPDKKYSYLPPKNGKATATFPNGDSYTGEYREGKKHGQGVYTFASGATYDGEYVENKKEGFGTFTAPDKGKYTGQWQNDKRHGEGTYTYPNGDSYTGGWKNGSKHGPGSYTYKGLDNSAVNGTWSNGQCVDGQFKMHDGSQYIGSFLSNQPAGEGLYVFPNGNNSSGKFVDQTFVSKSFERPHPNAEPPKPRAAEPFRKATRAIDKCVTKLDHSNNMQQLKALFQGVPNFRQAGGSVAGCGQPSLEGFKACIEHLKENGMDTITWVNLREDPVVYVSGMPFSPRDKRELDEQMRFPQLDDVKALQDLETRLQDNIKFQVRRKGGLHNYYEDVHNIDTAQKANVQKTIQVNESDDIKALTAMYEYLEEEEFGVTPKRVPLPDDRSPSLDDFGAVAQVIREAEGGGIVFNDTLGGPKTTTAMVAALLMLGSGEEEEEEEEDVDNPKKKKETAAYDPAEPDLAKGQYSVVMQLVSLLDGPDPEEERKRKLEEAAKAKAEAEEAKRKAEEEAKAKAAEEAEANEGDEGDANEEEKKEETEDDGDEGDEGEEEEQEEDDKEEGEGDEEEELQPLEWIKLGTMAKEAVDDAIDKCSSIISLRACILEARTRHDSAGPEEQTVIKRQALSMLERYCYLLLFAAYLKDMKDNPQTEPKVPKEGEDEGGDDEEEEEDGEAKPLSFKNWVNQKPKLLENLGTRTKGALSEFAWN